MIKQILFISIALFLLVSTSTSQSSTIDVTKQTRLPTVFDPTFEKFFQQEQRIYKGSSSFSSVKFLKDNSKMLFFDGDSLKLYDMDKKEILKSQQLRSSFTPQVNDIFVSDDESICVVASSDYQLVAIDLNTFESLYNFYSSNGQFTTADFNKKTKNLVVGRNDGSILIWDVTTGEQNLQLRDGDNTQKIVQIRFLDENRLLTLSLDNYARIWSLSEKKVLAYFQFQFPSNKTKINRAALSSDSSLIAISTYDEEQKNIQTNNLVQLFNIVQEKFLATLKNHLKTIYILEFSQDNSRLVTGGQDEYVLVWDLSNYQQVSKLLLQKNGQLQQAEISNDNSRIILQVNQNVTVWGLNNGQLQASLIHDYDVKFIKFYPSGDKVLTFTSYYGYTWNLNQYKEGIVINGHNNTITKLSLSKDGNKLITISPEDNQALFWDLKTGQKLDSFNKTQTWEFDQLLISNNQNFFLGTRRGQVKVYDFNNGTLLYTLNTTYSYFNSNYNIKISRDDSKILITSEKTLFAYNSTQGSLLYKLDNCTSNIDKFAISEDNQFVVSSCGNNATISRLSDGTVRYILSGHLSDITSIAISQDSTRVVTGSRDATVKVWSLKDGSLITTLRKGLIQPIQQILFTFDDTKIIVLQQYDSGNNKQIYVFSNSNFKRIFSIESYPTVNKLIISPDSSQLATINKGQNLVELFDLTSSGRKVNQISGNFYNIRDFLFLTNDKIITTGQDNTAVILNLNTNNLSISKLNFSLILLAIVAFVTILLH